MKIVQEVSLISIGSFEESSDWCVIRTEIRDAISLIVYPPGTSSFTINPTKHGNYEELEPYFDVWRAVKIQEGFLAIFVIEHDQVDSNVPTLTKGTDGRALV
jgi:Restriction endonuclease BamHI